MTIRRRPGSALRIGSFLLRERLARLVDHYVHRQRREEAVREFVLGRATPGSPSSVLRTMDEFARARGWLQNVGPVKGAILLAALRDANARRVLEIGSYCGYSATLIGQHLARHEGHLTTIEISRRNAAVARAVIRHARLEDTVTLRHGTLESEAATLGPPFDAVFLDHWKDVYLSDLRMLEDHRLLRAGTVVIADNVGFFEVPDYLDHVRHCGQYQSRYVQASVEYREDIEDGVEISIFQGCKDVTTPAGVLANREREARA